MPKEIKPSQHAMVKVLLRETDNGEYRKRKLDLSKELGLSYPTYMKLAEGKTDLTIPVLWAWCDLVNVSPNEVYIKAKVDEAIEAGQQEGIWPIEMLNMMPTDVKDGFMELMFSVAKGFKLASSDGKADIAGVQMVGLNSPLSSKDSIGSMVNYMNDKRDGKKPTDD